MITTSCSDRSKTCCKSANEHHKDVVAEIKLISNTNVHILKIISASRFNNKKIVITMRELNADKWVELIKNYAKEYQVFRPLLIVFHQIMYYSKLNDPYSVR